MKKSKLKIKPILMLILLIVLVIGVLFFFNKDAVIIKKKENKIMYISSAINNVITYDLEYNEKDKLTRGLEVEKIEKLVKDEKNYYKVNYKDKFYVVSEDNLVNEKNDIVKENKVYVRTPATIYKESNNISILGIINQGEEVEILSYDEIDDSGNVNMYKIKYNDITGYIYGKYITFDLDSSKLPYENYNELHSKSGSTLGGGNAGNLDYYPRVKPKFEDNVMPETVNALYLNGSRLTINNVDKYIELAKDTNINAFVVDIKDNQVPAYKSPVMEKYSPTNYKYANNEFDNYKAAIKKLNDAGFYTIGRITVFKDKYYVEDHPESAITDTRTNKPFLHSSTYWPSPFNRGVWEFNVALAIEGIKEMEFNEINFDYVRFPDRTTNNEKNGLMDLKNSFNEEKAQAIQRFLMYATDEIHKVGGYVSGDVFGESAHKYVTAYGQYYGAMANVLDVISPMPYPDHFSNYEYGFKTPVYKIPYDLLNFWTKNYVLWHQENVPTPAVTRSWIQTYDSYKGGGYPYGVNEVDAQIRAFHDNGVTGGFMTWNSGSSLKKYTLLKDVWTKEY